MCLPELIGNHKFEAALGGQAGLYVDQVSMRECVAKFFQDPPDCLAIAQVDGLQECLSTAPVEGGVVAFFRFYPGVTLSEVGRISLEQAIAVLEALLSAYAEMPDDWIHGDLHPGNILFTAGDKVVLLDWVNEIQTCALSRQAEVSSLLSLFQEYGVVIDAELPLEVALSSLKACRTKRRRRLLLFLASLLVMVPAPFCIFLWLAPPPKIKATEIWRADLVAGFIETVSRERVYVGSRVSVDGRVGVLTRIAHHGLVIDGDETNPIYLGVNILGGSYGVSGSRSTSGARISYYRQIDPDDPVGVFHYSPPKGAVSFAGLEEHKIIAPREVACAFFSQMAGVEACACGQDLVEIPQLDVPRILEQLR